jgi:RNA polymerase sigma-70 factor (ECF subfamily)
MVKEDERQIVERILAGSELALRQIVDHHTQPIFNYVRRMTSNSIEAEDITQETFIRFWVSRDRFDPGRVKLTTWLHRIAHNLCVDHFRRKQLQGRQLPEQSDADENPSINYELSLRAASVRKGLMTLSERQRSAIVLCHYQNFSQHDAAHIMNLSVDALESLLRRGRHKLKQILAKELE